MLGIDPRDWPAVNVLLDRAMDLQPELREAWLDALPPESAAYRDTLKRLLAAEGGVETIALFSELPRVDVEAVAADMVMLRWSPAPASPLFCCRRSAAAAWAASGWPSGPTASAAQGGTQASSSGWAPGLAERVERGATSSPRSSTRTSRAYRRRA
jgi:hypothetical protein